MPTSSTPGGIRMLIVWPSLSRRRARSRAASRLGVVLTIDRAAGGALVVIGLVTLWESRQYPLGTLHRPGPSYMPVMLALLLIAFGLALALMGARSGRMRDVRWHEW